MKSNRYSAAAPLPFAQRGPVSDKAADRRAEKLLRNMDRGYVAYSRPLMRTAEGGLDFVHVDVPALDGKLTERRYPKGQTYNVGSNAQKRANRRAHVVARLAARLEHANG